ncbi:chaplin [Streptacidiphilus anmyonensis]|uniref:chaplin n=1 Tax=Streptacidiphilus anmyonensis TaxID=405782 RepID=UPI0007C7617D
MRKPSRLAAAGVLAAGLVLGACGVASADATANGVATNSPGFLSGNLIQVPVHIPVNICGNTVNVLAAGNPAGGNLCVNGEHVVGAGHEMGADHEMGAGHEMGADHMAWQHHWWQHSDAATDQNRGDDQSQADDQSQSDDHGQDCD